jgi:uncharacterized protein YbbC (DUF1343 family)
MHPIPVLHGMTIGEYSQMINGEHWLKDGISCKLTIIPCSFYNRKMQYSLPIKPSPNLPNDKSINILACAFFEGTNVSVGRGTENNFKFMAHPICHKVISVLLKTQYGSTKPSVQWSSLFWRRFIE